MLPFRFLTSAVFAFFRPLQFWILTTQPLRFRSLSSCFRPAVASSVLRFRFRALGLPRSPPPDFSCVPSRFRYLASLFVSFRPSLIHSHSCSSGAYFRLSPSVFSASRPLSFVRFRSASGYLAFCFFLSFSSRFRLTAAFPVLRFRSRFPSFPLLPGLISHAFLPVPSTRLFCWFPFVLPCFAPAAVPQVIPFRFFPPGPVPDFRFLSSASVLASHYSASVSSFPPSRFPPLSGFRRSRFRSRFLASRLPSCLISHAFSPASRTRLPVRFLSPFLASLPQLFHECLPSAFAFGLSPFSPVLTTQLSCSSVPFLPGSASQLLSRCRPLRFRFPGFPLPLHPVSRASLPLSVLGFSAGFLSSLPVPLPQPLPWCLPSSGSSRPLLFGLFRSPPLSFVRDRSLLTTQLSALSFPCFPLSPGIGSFGALRFPASPSLPPSAAPVSMRAFRLRYSALCSSFLPRPIRLADGYLVRFGMPFGLAAAPWLSLSVPVTWLVRFGLFSSASDLHILPSIKQIVNCYFLSF